MCLTCLLAVITVAGCGVAAPAQNAGVGQAAGAGARGKVATQFDRGRALVHSGKFDEAVVALDAFLKDHPGHKLASRAWFLRAKSQWGAHQTEAAIASFQDVIQRFPNSDEARKSEFKLAMVEFLNGDIEKAKAQLTTIAAAANGPYTPEATAWVKYLDNEAQ